MVIFTAHLSVTIKRLTRHNFAAMFEGKSMLSSMVANLVPRALFPGFGGGGGPPPKPEKSALGRTLHGGQYKSHYFVEKSKCHIISPLIAFPLKFRV